MRHQTMTFLRTSPIMFAGGTTWSTTSSPSHTVRVFIRHVWHQAH